MVAGSATRKPGGPRPLPLPRYCPVGKVSYVTMSGALLAAALHTKKYREPRYAYFHTDCRQFHLTHIESLSAHA